MQNLKIFLEYLSDLLKEHNAEMWIGGESLDLSDSHIHFRINGSSSKNVEFMNVALGDMQEINAHSVSNLIKKI